jgi:outer membrane protein TolC
MTRVTSQRACLRAASTLPLTLLLGLTVSGQSGLSLDDAVQQALRSHPSIRLSDADRQVALADLTTAAQPFAPRLRTFLQDLGEQELFRPSEGLSDRFFRHSFDSGIVVEKTIRSGIRFGAELSFSRIERPAIDINQATSGNLRTAITLPLLAGSGGGVDAVAEQTARRYVESARASFHHALAAVAFEAIAAYWQLVAAHKQLDVHQESEKRAQQLVDETKLLITADERAPSELDLIAANLASKRGARLRAELQVRAARSRLGLAIAGVPTAIHDLVRPTTDFPSAPASPDWITPATASTEALERRNDLRAITTRSGAAEALRERALREVRPRLDLQFTGLYKGLLQDDDAEPSLSPFHGLGAAWALVYEPTAVWGEARSRAQHAAAEATRAQALLDQTRRDVSLQAMLAAEALTNSYYELEAVEEAVSRSMAAVETEQKRFHAGVATIFDAILAADTLNNALLGEIDAQARYAIARARLRLETGTLVTLDQPAPRVDLASLM